MYTPTRRTFIAGSASAGIIGIAGCLGDSDDDDTDDTDDADDTVDPGDDADDADDTPADDGDDEPVEATYEVWAADQGTHVIHIYEPNENGELTEVDQIDTGAEDGEVPHMVHFSSDYEYAAIACTAGARTLVYRTEDRELVANLETGASSHFAGFNPADDAIIVDVIGENKIVRIDADLDAEEFSIDDEIVIGELDGFSEDQDPVCHSYDQNGRSIHTLGPNYHHGGVVIVDHENFDVYESFTHEELPANCGTMPHPTEPKFYLTAGNPSDDEADPDDEPLDYEGVGRYYVLDTENYEIIAEESTQGIDAHGFWFVNDGDELWVLNRETNDGVIVDPATDDVIDEIDEFGPGDDERPDIMWSTPDTQTLFVTLRGPNPRSAAHVAVGETPGFAVFDVQSRDRIDIVEPAEGNEDSDFHGIGVRPLGDIDGGPTSPPY